MKHCAVLSPHFVGDYHEMCGLPPQHAGFHKSNHMAWPSNDDLTDWANVGMRLLCGESIPTLSLREIEYAIAAANAHDEGNPL